MAKKNSIQKDNLQEIESALTKSEQFIEDNQNKILYFLGTVAVVVLVYLGTARFVIEPRSKEAGSQMFMAENYFERDSFSLALNGDGNYLGFLDIIEDYGMTKAAKLARFYAGVSHLRLGEYEEAISMLQKFKTKDLLLGPVKEGSIGDAYLELGNDSRALQQYRKAADLNDNEFTTPIYLMKAAGVLEMQGKFSDALAVYNRIKESFPNTTEGQNIEKHIARAQILAQN